MKPPIVQKLWNYCNVLRDDGMSYGDYVEQLTYLLFLKMADERTQKPYSQKSIVPDEYSWQSLIKRDGDELFDHYRHVLEALGREKGLLGLIFGKSQNKFQDPAKLRRLIVDLIDKENWSRMTNPLQRSDLDDFVKCYKVDARARRKATWSEDLKELSPGQSEYKGRWRGFDYDELVARDEASLDIFWLRDESLEDSDNLPEPGVIAQEIVADLEAALVQFREVTLDRGVEEVATSPEIA